ncbi:MAG: N-acetylmuramoyl-L-alanine amidase [Bacillus sp. (in: Bacteria)]|nr:N-acetylmuramoyl-L-alanine amidase [Bacillus sp. (in: firmicutes)]
MLKIKTKFMTRNDCYKAGRKITPKGIMIHSTATPGVMAADWFRRWNKSYQAGEINRQVCVHAFVDDREAWQYLPWNHRGWHSGGTANNSYIGVEMCEPGGFSYGSGATMVGYDVKRQEPYFRQVWENTVSLSAKLCQMYGLTEKNIISHSEGFRRGVASNHADTMHWFPKHGMTMDQFRAAVKTRLLLLRDSIEMNGDTGGGETVKEFQGGDLVEIIGSADRYYPGGPVIPAWVKEDFYHKITQIQYGHTPVVRGGKPCVLLGRRIAKTSGIESPGIMTWVASENLKLLQRGNADIRKAKAAEGTQKLYRVQVGAFADRANAERMAGRLKASGFEALIVS